MNSLQNTALGSYGADQGTITVIFRRPAIVVPIGRGGISVKGDREKAGGAVEGGRESRWGNKR